MNTENLIHAVSIAPDGPAYSDMSARKSERKVAKQQRKGDKERAKLGLLDSDLAAPPQQAGGSKTLWLIGGAVAVVAVIIMFILKKRK
jgi:hypothetical protein